MSRTRHATPSQHIHYMRVQNRRKAEMAALEALLEENAHIRHRNRLQSFLTQIPEPFDDKPHSAWKEFHNKLFINEWREKQDAPHFVFNLVFV